MLLDGAHNVAGAETLRRALETEFPDLRPVFIIGALADKDWPDICKILAPLAARCITVPVASDRTADAKELTQVWRTANPRCEVLTSRSLREALAHGQDAPFVVITGSLYLVGEALELLGISPLGTNERALNEWTSPAPGSTGAK